MRLRTKSCNVGDESMRLLQTGLAAFGCGRREPALPQTVRTRHAPGIGAGAPVVRWPVGTPGDRRVRGLGDSAVRFFGGRSDRRPLVRTWGPTRPSHTHR